MLRFLFMQCFADFVHTYIIFSIFLSFDTTRIGTQKIDFVSNRMAFLLFELTGLDFTWEKKQIKLHFILYKREIIFIDLYSISR